MASASNTFGRTRGATAVALLLAAALLAAMAPSAYAQTSVPTGQNAVCCAYILASKGGPWQLVCNNPTNVSACSHQPAS
jgi:invasion protein IalB